MSVHVKSALIRNSPVNGKSRNKLHTVLWSNESLLNHEKRKKNLTRVTEPTDQVQSSLQGNSQYPACTLGLSGNKNFSKRLSAQTS